jgi:cytochrome c biogenesis protein CcmG/thiol:disulfide interchange protein DsbE
MKKFLPILILAFLLGVIGLSTHKINKSQDKMIEQHSLESEGSNVGFTPVKIHLPDFSLPDLFDDSANFSKKDLQKNYSLINFFASWCTTCRAEHAILMRLHDEKIIDIYGVAWRDIDDKTKEYLAREGNPFTKTAKDSQGLFHKITGIEAVPETLLIDKEGNVVMRFRGNLQEFAIDEIKEFLKQHQ